MRAAARLEPARLSWGSGVIDFVMNRREFTPNGVILGVNPRGLADRSVPVLRVESPDGKPLAVLFGAATHNTTLGGDNYQICGDYAGFAQAYVREKMPGVQAMFMLGCAGDSNPYPRGTMELARKHGEALGAEVCRVLGGKLKPVRGPLRIAFERVDLPLQTSLTREELKKLADDKRSPKAGVAGQLLALLDKGEKLPDHYTCPVTVWQFGADLTLVGLSGEVVVDYLARLEKALGPNQLWVAGVLQRRVRLPAVGPGARRGRVRDARAVLRRARLLRREGGGRLGRGGARAGAEGGTEGARIGRERG